MKSKMLNAEIEENLEEFCKGCTHHDLSIHKAYEFAEMKQRNLMECSHIGLCRHLFEHLKKTYEGEEE